jgi:hypothetical protein
MGYSLIFLQNWGREYLPNLLCKIWSPQSPLYYCYYYYYYYYYIIIIIINIVSCRKNLQFTLIFLRRLIRHPRWQEIVELMDLVREIFDVDCTTMRKSEQLETMWETSDVFHSHFKEILP